MNKRLFKNPNILTIMISCIIIVILLLSSNGFRVMNKTIQNDYYAVKNDFFGQSVNPHIIIAEINDESFQKIGTFPFPRSVYATVLDNLSAYEIAVIGIDVLFLDASNPEDDATFSQALNNADNVVLGAAYDSSREFIPPYVGFESFSYISGYLHPNVDVSNRTVYSFTPKLTDVLGNSYEHFAIKIVRSFYKYVYGEVGVQNSGMYTDRDYVLTDNEKIPLARQNSDDILINFMPNQSFTRVSISDLYDEKKLREIDKIYDLKDSIILIGPAAEGLNDSFFTPNGEEYGVNIHANILNTLLQKNYMMYFDAKLEWIMIFLIVVLSVFANLSPSNKVLLLSNISIIFLFWIIIPLSILLGTNLIINYPSEIIFSLLLSIGSANIVKYLIEDKNKQRLSKALSEYVGTSIANEILGEHGAIDFDGQEKELVFFFSDIEGFTNMSEHLGPQELVGFLREYLSAMTSIIMDEKGYVDKFQGDSVMAFWGAFEQHKDEDYIKVCKSALKQQEAARILSEKYKNQVGKSLRVRMGIHGGKAIIGNIGALGKKMDFTALGDNVNLASRLEGVNKYYNTDICVSEIVYKSTQDVFEFRFLDTIQVKGKDIPVKIYELLGEKGSTLQNQQERIGVYIQAHDFYLQRKFGKARELFQQACNLGDGPSHMYVQRCTSYLKTPPGADWDAVWRMMEK